MLKSGFAAFTLLAILFFIKISYIEGEIVRADLCELPKDKGPCLALMHKYYFNRITKRCEEFIYGGCQGNDNRFDTREECRVICLEPLE